MRFLHLILHLFKAELRELIRTYGQDGFARVLCTNGFKKF